MKQKIASAVITLTGLALLAFTATRTVDFISLTLPANQQVIGWLALVAFDGGLIGWTLFYLHGARGAWQRGIAALMILVSLAGVLAAFVADTMYQSAARGTIAAVDPAMVEGAIWGMSVVIGLNVAAVTLTHITDPEARRAQAEEEARDKITEAALRQIAANAESLAAELAPRLGAQWLAQMRAQYSAGLGQPATPWATLPAAPAQQPEPWQQPAAPEPAHQPAHQPAPRPALAEPVPALAEPLAVRRNGNGRKPAEGSGPK